MKIGIDARVVSKYPGLGRACLNLLRELPKTSTSHEFVIYTYPNQLFPDKDDLRFLRNTAQFRLVQLNFPVLSLRTLIWLGKIIERERFDLFHSPFQVTTIFPPCPLVVTVHDMMDLAYPDAFSHHPFPIRQGLKMYFKFAVPKSILQSKKIIVPSHSVKEDILKYFSIPDDKIKVILEGVDPVFGLVSDGETILHIRKKYSLPEKYIFYLGSIKPYKNLNGILEAYSKLLKLDARNREYKMVIAGLKHFNYLDLNKISLRLGIADQLVNIGYIPDEELSVVYSSSTLFIFPSLYEGFGLPPLEAMACGTPVISSNTSSLVEVVGDAGILVNPRDTDRLAIEMHHLIINSNVREALIKKGLERVKRFTWERAAQETLQVYESVVTHTKP